MREQEKINNYQQLEIFAANTDYDWLQDTIYCDNHTYFLLLEAEIESSHLLPEMNRGFKLSFWQKIKLGFLQYFVVRSVIEVYGWSRVFLSVPVLICPILLLFMVGSEKYPALANIVFALEKSSWIGVGLVLVSVIFGMAALWTAGREIYEDKETKLEVRLDTPARIKLRELRYLFVKLSTMNLNPEIIITTNFDDKSLEIKMTGRVL